MNRRGFMELAGSALILGTTGGVDAQVDQPDGDLDVYGLVLDTSRPGQPVIEQEWDTYRLVHLNPATGEKAYINHTTSGWESIPMPLPETQVDEVRTREFTPFLDHTFARPEAPDDKNWVYADADVTKVDSEIELTSTTTLDSTQRGNYAPGTEAIPGVAGRVTGTPTAGRAEMGYLSDNNGFAAGEDSTDSYALLRKAGSDHVVYRSDWNGYVPNERVWVNDSPVITRWPHLFYGGGSISIRALLHEDGETRLRTLHTFTPENTPGSGPPFDQPNLPIRFSSDGLSGGALRANAAHYEFGNSEAETRVNGEEVTGASVGTGGFQHIISWRKRSGWEMVNVKPLEVIMSAAGSNAVFELQLDPTLGDESASAFSLPTNTDSDETAVEISTSNTITTVGNRRWVGTAVAGQGNSSGAAAGEELDFNLPAGQIVTLAGYGVGGTADLFGKVEWEEFF